MKLPQLFIYCLALISCFILLQCESNIPFDSKQWQHEDKAQRINMLNDLLTNQHLIGKSKQAILTQLGKPDDELLGNDSIQERIMYDIPSNNMFDYTMILFFDQKGGQVTDILIDD